jgi:hypothetical protein
MTLRDIINNTWKKTKREARTIATATAITAYTIIPTIMTSCDKPTVEPQQPQPPKTTHKIIIEPLSGITTSIITGQKIRFPANGKITIDDKGKITTKQIQATEHVTQKGWVSYTGITTARYETETEKIKLTFTPTTPTPTGNEETTLDKVEKTITTKKDTIITLYIPQKEYTWDNVNITTPDQQEKIYAIGIKEDLYGWEKDENGNAMYTDTLATFKGTITKGKITGRTGPPASFFRIKFTGGSKYAKPRFTNGSDEIEIDVHRGTPTINIRIPHYVYDHYIILENTKPGQESKIRVAGGKIYDQSIATGNTDTLHNRSNKRLPDFLLESKLGEKEIAKMVDLKPGYTNTNAKIE